MHSMGTYASYSTRDGQEAYVLRRHKNEHTAIGHHEVNICSFLKIKLDYI